MRPDEERLLDQFEERWRMEQTPDLTSFVAEHLSSASVDDRVRLVGELIKIDLEHRWRSPSAEGQRRLEAYLPHFPELANIVELIAEEYLVRHIWGDAPQRCEYFERFPHLKVPLELALSQVDAMLARRHWSTTKSSQRSESSSTWNLSQGVVSSEPLVAPEIQDIPKTVGRFAVERMLGRGSFGSVFLAHDPQLQRPVAIKVLHHRLWNNRKVCERFLHEARLAATMRHPSLVSVYDFLDLDSTLYLVMEYVDGQTLTDQINSPRTPRDIARLIAEISAAVHAAHQVGLVHRDLKPGNILIDRSGHPHITDFGLAARQEELSNRTGELAGTPCYMAPEQIRQTSQPLDGRLDIWSIGVILYELLTRRRPFLGKSVEELFDAIERNDPQPPGDINSEVPLELEAICMRCLSKKIQHRYTTGRELTQELEHFLREQGGKGEQHRSKASPRGGGETAGNLPHPVSSFVGRRKELRFIASLLTEARTGVVTLSGPGGIGKTRLALEAAMAVRGDFVGGCWAVDLSSATTAAEVASAVLHAFGVSVREDQSAEELVATLLEYRPPLLLVLDNFEQAVEQAAETIARWRQAAPQTRLLVTSRTSLGIAGERTVELQPLALPAAAGSDDLSQTAGAESIELFVQRAREVRPAFLLTESNVTDVVEICRRVEGIPLAVELAAARVHVLTPAQIVAKLAENMDALRSNRHDLSPRQQTLTAAVDWSFQLLTPWEQQALLQLSLFPSGFALEAAEAVIDAADLPHAVTADYAVERLRAQCLLRRWDDDDEYRFGMYHMIREHALRLRQQRFTSQQQCESEMRAARWLADYAKRQNTQLHTSGGASALRRLTRDSDNILAACGWSAQHGEGELAARLLLAVCESLDLRGKLSGQLDRLSSTAQQAPPALTASLCVRLSQAQQAIGRWKLAAESAHRAVDLAEQAGARPELATALHQHGEMLRLRGNWTAALAVFQRGQALAEECGQQRSVAISLASQGMILWQSGELDAALERYAQAAAIAHDLDDQALMASAARSRGHVLLQRGQCQGALACFEQAAGIARELGDRRATHRALTSRGSALAELGDYDAALNCYQEAEAIARDTGERRSIAVNQGNRGLALADLGKYEEALTCFAAAETINREMSMTAGVALNLGNRGAALAAMQQYDNALALLRQAEEMHRELGNRMQIAINEGDAGVVLWKLGRNDEARAALTSALATFRELSADGSLDCFDFQTALAAIESGTGNAAAARATIADSLRLAEALNIGEDHPRLRTRDNFAMMQRLNEQLFLSGMSAKT